VDVITWNTIDARSSKGEYQTLSWPCFGYLRCPVHIAIVWTYLTQYRQPEPPVSKLTVARQVSAISHFRPSSFFGTPAGRNCVFSELCPPFSVAQYRRVARPKVTKRLAGHWGIVCQDPGRNSNRNTDRPPRPILANHGPSTGDRGVAKSWSWQRRCETVTAAAQNAALRRYHAHE
jgi:hypothetical protein